MSDIVVRIEHPLGALEVSLDIWAKFGPGGRLLLRPTAAFDRATRKRIGLWRIPIAYRNTALSRWLIRRNLIRDPWAKA